MKSNRFIFLVLFFDRVRGGVAEIEVAVDGALVVDGALEAAGGGVVVVRHLAEALKAPVDQGPPRVSAELLDDDQFVPFLRLTVTCSVLTRRLRGEMNHCVQL